MKLLTDAIEMVIELHIEPDAYAGEARAQLDALIAENEALKVEANNWREMAINIRTAVMNDWLEGDYIASPALREAVKAFRLAHEEGRLQ